MADFDPKAYLADEDEKRPVAKTSAPAGDFDPKAYLAAGDEVSPKQDNDQISPLRDNSPGEDNPPGMLRTFMAHAADSAALGQQRNKLESQERSLKGMANAFGYDSPPEGTLTKEFDRDYNEGGKANPYTAAAGDAAGFVAGIPGMAGLKALQAASKLGKFGKIAGFLGRTAAGAGVGGATSAATAAGHGDDPIEAGKQGALFGGAATAAPLATGAYSLGTALATDDPQEQASKVVNGLALGLPGLAAKTGIISKPLVEAGKTARQGIVSDLVKALLTEETKAVKDRNRTAAKDALAFGKRLQRSTSPVGGNRPGGVGGADPLSPEAQAAGKLGSEAQEAYRFLRSKDALGLKLSPEAEAGVQALLPDYESNANAQLGKFSGGKAALLQKILAELGSQGEAPADAGAKAPSHLGFFPNPELLPTTGQLKPNLLAGVPQEPLPTEASVLPKAEAQVPGVIDALRAEKGIGSRLLGGAAKGAVSLPGIGGAVVAGPKGVAGGAAIGGAKALLRDPVLATKIAEPVGLWLQKYPAMAKRLGQFLGTATGPMLTKKVQWLADNDPEFAAALEKETNGQF